VQASIQLGGGAAYLTEAGPELRHSPHNSSAELGLGGRPEPGQLEQVEAIARATLGLIVVTRPAGTPSAGVRPEKKGMES